MLSFVLNILCMATSYAMHLPVRLETLAAPQRIKMMECFTFSALKYGDKRRCIQEVNVHGITHEDPYAVGTVR